MNSADLLRYLKTPALLNESTLDDMKNLVSEYPWFGTGWLLYARNLKNLNHSDFQSVLKNAAFRFPDRIGLKHFLERGDGEVKPDGNVSSSETAGDFLSTDNETAEETITATGKKRLIEDFLAKGAVFKPLTPGEAEKDLPDLAEVAIRENDDIVTETYANLLLSQGKYEKATVAFKKLSLKYPEKSIYFAARMEEIKKIAEKK